jgi:hypothetical protein
MRLDYRNLIGGSTPIRLAAPNAIGANLIAVQIVRRNSAGIRAPIKLEISFPATPNLRRWDLGSYEE